MSGSRRPGRGGRRGRRTTTMIRVARERISDLFELAEGQARAGRLPLATRYVSLARRIGTRYNVRLLPEYREAYCRRCSTYWVEGRTVRTRIRSGRRVRHCLVCGRDHRKVLRPRRFGSAVEESSLPERFVTASALVGELPPPSSQFDGAEEEDE